MITAVELPAEFERQLRAESLYAFPRECCGLVEGVADGARARAIALHPMPNISNEADRFEIDPASHIALLRNLRGTGRGIIGCYHSHPNGRADPSERDCESAVEPGFVWLICAVDADTRETNIAAFVSTGRSLSPVPIPDVPGTSLDRLAVPPI